MRIVFMGSPDFAVPSLNALVEAGHEVVAVYSQPPRPAGRGKAERKTAVHERAEQLGIEVRTPRTLRDAEEQGRFRGARRRLGGRRGLRADPAQADPRCAQGGLRQRPCLAAARAGAARRRSSARSSPATRSAESPSCGWTKGSTPGPMLLKRELDIRGKNAGQVTEEMAKLGADALVEWLAHPTPPQPQPDDGATYASKIDKAEARIDWSRAGRGDRTAGAGVRARCRAPGSRLMASGSSCSTRQSADDAAGKPGEVLDDCLTVACGDGLHPAAAGAAGRARADERRANCCAAFRSPRARSCRDPLAADDRI